MKDEWPLITDETGQKVIRFVYDVFISHAANDKEAVARPLAAILIERGYRVWFDELTLNVGDSLRRAIDRGLNRSLYGIVVLSPDFFAKNWPQYELDGLNTREMADGKKVILPIWHCVDFNAVAQYSPSLADRLALVTTLPIEVLADRLAAVIGPAPGPHAPKLPIEREPWISAICQRCGQRGHTWGADTSDDGWFAMFQCPYCGFWKSNS